MFRIPNGNFRSKYRPMWQSLPRSLNVHYHWFELEGADKPKRALFIAASWAARKVLYYGTNAALLATVATGLLAWADQLPADVPYAFGILTLVLWPLAMLQEVTSALVRGRDFRFDGGSPDHGYAVRPDNPLRVQVVEGSAQID